MNGEASRLEAGGDSSIEIVRDTARVSGGPAYLFYAPFILRDADTARAMRRQPEVARALGKLPLVSKAIVGIGLCEPGHSTIYDVVGTGEQRQLRKLGVRAEVSGVLIDKEGEPVRAALTDRMIGVTAAQLAGCLRSSRSHGVQKAPAVHAALVGGLVHSLMTLTALAESMVGPDTSVGV